MSKSSPVWAYRGRRLKRLEWGPWKDVDRPGYFFLCYRPGGRSGPVVRRWAYADGRELRLDDLLALVCGVHARRAMAGFGIEPAAAGEEDRCRSSEVEAQSV